MNIQPGGSLIIAWQAKDKPALVVGAGDVACGRVNNLLNADAIVTIVAPTLTNDSLSTYVKSNPPNLTYIQKQVVVPGSKTESHFESLSPEQLLLDENTNIPKFSIVLTAINTPGVSESIHKVCKQYGIPVNVADVPPLCDFYFASTIRKGPLQVAVSTGGSAPRLARRIRLDIEHSIDSLGQVENAIEKMGILRAKLRIHTDNNPNLHKTDQEKIRNRMKWMSAVCDSWSYSQLATMDEETMEKLVAQYPQPALPSSP